MTFRSPPPKKNIDALKSYQKPLLDVIFELFVSPHVLLRKQWVTRTVLVVLLYGIVRQMYGLIKVLQRVFLRAETEVAVLIEPDGQWVPIRYQEPLTDVELTVVD